MKQLFLVIAWFGFFSSAMAQGRPITLWGTSHLGPDAFESNDPCLTANQKVTEIILAGQNPDRIVYAPEVMSPAKRSDALQQIEDDHLRNYIGFFQSARSFTYYYLNLLQRGPQLTFQQYIDVWSNVLSTLMDPKDHPASKKILDQVIQKHANTREIQLLKNDLEYVREFYAKGGFPDRKTTIDTNLDALFTGVENRNVQPQDLQALNNYINAMQFLLDEGAKLYFATHIQPSKSVYDLTASQLPEISPEFQTVFDFLKPEVLMSNVGFQSEKIIYLTTLSLRNFFIAKNIEKYVQEKTDRPLLVFLGKAHLQGVVSMLMNSKAIPTSAIREIRILSSVDHPALACDPEKVMEIAAEKSGEHDVLKITDWASKSGIPIPSNLVLKPQDYQIQAYGLVGGKLEKEFSLQRIENEETLKRQCEFYLNQVGGLSKGVYLISAKSREGQEFSFKVVVSGK